jgi:hypothetical protein
VAHRRPDICRRPRRHRWERDPRAIWSPYYYITITQYGKPQVSVSEPPPDLLTMRDPPIYSVNVNQFGYHMDTSLDVSRFTPGTASADTVGAFWLQYHLPYELSTGRDRVLVVGAGGGCDVQAALMAGVRHVDAVEIDRTIIGISKKFSAGAPYHDPRVEVHIDDARSYLAKASPGYDLVVFGFLDSQALFSSMNNVRLDGYVYTVESIRSAYRLLGDHGLLSLSFYLGRQWLGPKLYWLVAEATGRSRPCSSTPPARGSSLRCRRTDGRSPRAPGRCTSRATGRCRTSTCPRTTGPSSTCPGCPSRTTTCRHREPARALDRRRRVAQAGLVRAGRRPLRAPRMGFLLLETKNITDCTLFFGATWFVTLVVVAGVLLMVIAANQVAERVSRFSPWMYAPLFATLALLLFVPRESILGSSWPAEWRGRCWSSRCRSSSPGSSSRRPSASPGSPAAVFGANLIGAMIGGFCEYLGMAVGNHRLSMLVIVAYLGSLLVVTAARRAGRAV